MFLNYVRASVILGVAPSAPVTLAASLVRYEYNSGEKRFQEQLQPVYSKQELQKLYYCICFGQNSEKNFEFKLNFEKRRIFVIQ